MSVNPNQVTVRIVGEDSDRGLVRLEHFTSFCDSLRRCLRSLEHDLTHSKPRTQYRIVDLRSESASITLEPVPSNGRSNVGREVVSVFKKTVRGLQSRSIRRPNIDERIEIDTLQAFRKLYDPFLKAPPDSHRRLRIDDVDIDVTFVANIQSLTVTPIKSLGSVSGRLEKLDIHNKRKFVIWPALHNARIICDFPDNLMSRVCNGIGQRVTVYGMLYYQREKPYPIRADVRDLEVLVDDDQLPTLSELRGSLKQATEPVASVRTMRDDY
ncbi:MAG: hypothetical protein KF861_04140 [Planctomycetaceae bacterium]|nr:hypothetical protein [Planctomycetaceae bacterium]